MELLSEDGAFSPEDPGDAAWLALSRGDIERARACHERHAALRDEMRHSWERDPEGAVRGAWYWPGLALRLSERALQITLDRRAQR